MTTGERRPGEPQVIVVDDATAIGRTAAEWLVPELAVAIELRGEAHLALTGGSTAIGLYRELAGAWSDALDWRRVHLWWGDERFVPVDHPESNAGMAYATLLAVAQRSSESGTGGQGTDVAADAVAGLDVLAENVHPYGIDEAAADSDAAELVAERYVAELLRYVPNGPDELPAFDAVLLGVGADGHVLSCFPGSAALAPEAPLVVAVPAPRHIGPHLPRITLNPRLLGAAGRLIVIVSGEAKAEAVRRALAEAGPADELPARLARRDNAVWVIDRAAAAQLAQRSSSE